MALGKFGQTARKETIISGRHKRGRCIRAMRTSRLRREERVLAWEGNIKRKENRKKRYSGRRMKEESIKDDIVFGGRARIKGSNRRETQDKDTLWASRGEGLRALTRNIR